MRTGEGKTLTATLAVVLNAMTGRGVHLVTVNDYLARRDAEWMSPVYEFLGRQGRRAAEHAALGPQARGLRGRRHLRHQLGVRLRLPARQHGRRWTLQQKVRTSAGRHFAIVDEVDNILIDEARTPLIISGAARAGGRPLRHVRRARAERLEAGKKPEGLDPRAKKDFVADYDYEFDEKHKTVSVTERGVEKAERFLGIDHLYRAENGHLVNHLQQALKAESLYKRDVDYAVVDGEVKIIDEFTGRILEGRRWSEGLHQAVEAKEGVRVQEENQTLATITLPELLPPLRQAGGHDRHGPHRGHRVHEDLRAAGGRDPHQPADGPRRPTTTRSTRPRTASGTRWSTRDRRSATRRASRCWWARSPSRSPSSSQASSPSRASSTPSSTPSPSTPSARARSSPRPAQPGAVTIATNMAGRGVDIKLGGNAEHLTEQQLRKEGPAARRPRRVREGLGRGPTPGSRPRSRPAREEVVEAGRPVHPRHRAPRVAADRQPAARPLRPPGRSRRVALLPLRRGRPGAPVRRRPHLRRSSTAWARSTRRARRSPSRHKMLTKQIEGPRRRSRSRTSSSASACSSTTT